MILYTEASFSPPRTICQRRLTLLLTLFEYCRHEKEKSLKFFFTLACHDDEKLIYIFFASFFLGTSLYCMNSRLVFYNVHDGLLVLLRVMWMQFNMVCIHHTYKIWSSFTFLHHRRRCWVIFYDVGIIFVLWDFLQRSLLEKWFVK